MGKFLGSTAITRMSVLFAAFAMSACGPMNHQANGGQNSATVNSGIADAAKDLGTKNNSYLISTKVLSTLVAGALPEGDDQIQIRAVHPDLTPLASTESINVQYFKVRQGEEPETPPNQVANQAVMATQPDGSVIATLSFKKPSKTTTIMITITNSAEPTLSDKKYVEVQVN